jgi:hypothetical protein
MDISTILTVGWRLAALVLGIGHWGWWLAALVAPKSAVLVAGLLVVYGLGVGWGSVVPASRVIAMAIALLVAFDILPPFWADTFITSIGPTPCCYSGPPVLPWCVCWQRPGKT